MGSTLHGFVCMMNFQLKFVVFTALKITVYCIGVFAYVDKIIGNKSHMMP